MSDNVVNIGKKNANGSDENGAEDRRKLHGMALQYLENKEFNKECPACAALMPRNASFCFECGSVMGKIHASLVTKITRNMILVVGTATILATTFITLTRPANTFVTISPEAAHKVLNTHKR